MTAKNANVALNTYEIREGDGNQGCYHRGMIQAPNAFEALRRASRKGMIRKPYDVKLNSMDGDDRNAYLASYVAPIYGDACRWIAESHLVKASEPIDATKVW